MSCPNCSWPSCSCQQRCRRIGTPQSAPRGQHKTLLQGRWRRCHSGSGRKRSGLRTWRWALCSNPALQPPCWCSCSRAQDTPSPWFCKWLRLRSRPCSSAFGPVRCWGWWGRLICRAVHNKWHTRDWIVSHRPSSWGCSGWVSSGRSSRSFPVPIGPPRICRWPRAGRWCWRRWRRRSSCRRCSGCRWWGCRGIGLWRWSL